MYHEVLTFLFGHYIYSLTKLCYKNCSNWEMWTRRTVDYLWKEVIIPGVVIAKSNKSNLSDLTSHEQQFQQMRRQVLNKLEARPMVVEDRSTSMIQPEVIIEESKDDSLNVEYEGV